MIVCVCHRVTESQIAGHAQAGCCSFDELQDELRVGTGCGACLDCARSTFECAQRSAPGAGMHHHRPAAVQVLAAA